MNNRQTTGIPAYHDCKTFAVMLSRLPVRLVSERA
jgi:hypothetical protein